MTTAHTLCWQDVSPMEAMFTHCTEASSIGLRAGQWPESIPVDPTFGNARPLGRHQPRPLDGELVAVIYKQLPGCIYVPVLNDKKAPAMNNLDTAIAALRPTKGARRPKGQV